MIKETEKLKILNPQYLVVVRIERGKRETKRIGGESKCMTPLTSNKGERAIIKIELSDTSNQKKNKIQREREGGCHKGHNILYMIY